ncbi:MAG: hypothetical protein PHQ60_11300 [Sideroxydans sp.]|nr:hypothetical protein [Sideroxydans sp.]
MFEDAHLQAGGYISEGRDGTMTDAKKMAKKISGNSLFVEQRNAGLKT